MITIIVVSIIKLPGFQCLRIDIFYSFNLFVLPPQPITFWSKIILYFKIQLRKVGRVIDQQRTRQSALGCLIEKVYSHSLTHSLTQSCIMFVQYII